MGEGGVYGAGPTVRGVDFSAVSQAAVLVGDMVMAESILEF